MADPAPIRIHWPNGTSTWARAGMDWLLAAQEAQLPIPTGCLGGSCGACEITLDGETIRACIAVVPISRTGHLTVEFSTDPSW